MTLEQAQKFLEEEYERAKALDWVRNPVAYALYKTWEKADKDRRLTEVAEMRKVDEISKAMLENFAERINRYYKTLNGKTNSNLVAYHIDEVLKEMIGETK